MLTKSKSIALILLLFVSMSGANAMSFTWLDSSTVRASGLIEAGDAAKFGALKNFSVLELDSPGGLVVEALTMAASMDARGGIRTEVKSGSECTSACAMVLFVSGETRIVYMGGRLGIHSCRTPEGLRTIECNRNVGANATAHGVPWDIIEGIGNYLEPTKIYWLWAEDAECWGLMKWNASDTSNNGECREWRTSKLEKRKPDDFSAENANYALCRMNSKTSRTYVSSGRGEQGYTDAYRSACERVSADPKTPRYAAIDIILWLSISDPNVEVLKPVTLMTHILNSDEKQVAACWKCLTIMGETDLLHGLAKDAVVDFQKAVNVVIPEVGGVPEWLASRLELAMREAAKENH
jgi:hypothetical protein